MREFAPEVITHSYISTNPNFYPYEELLALPMDCSNQNVRLLLLANHTNVLDKKISTQRVHSNGLLSPVVNLVSVVTETNEPM